MAARRRRTEPLSRQTCRGGPTSRRSTDGRPRRLRMAIGPGLVLALAAAGLILWSQRNQVGAPPGGGVLPGKPARTDIPPPPPAPELAFVLRQAPALALSKPQTRKLEQLAKQFEQATAGSRAELARASADFARQMRARAGNGITLSDLQKRAAAVSQLSRQLAAARRLYWARAARILTPAERARAEALWARQLGGGSRPPRTGLRR